MLDQEPDERKDSSKRQKVEKMCEICATNEFKYKCPRCLMKTCSLDCCRKHKIERDCNGQQDRTKFVDKEEFDDRVMLNDYRFLEEQSRFVDNVQRTLEQVTKHTRRELTNL